MQNWLEEYAYRIDIQWWMFAATAFVALIIASLTVGLQSIKAAMANPVQSLRSE
jgi:putative ABC transport system permease protein